MDPEVRKTKIWNHNIINRVGFLDRRSFRWIEQKKYKNFGMRFLRAEWIFLVRSKSPRSFSCWSCGQKIEKWFWSFSSVDFQGCWFRFFIGISLREVWKSTPEEFQFLSRFFSRNFNMSFESGFHRFLILRFISEECRTKVWNFNQHPGRICLIWFRIVWIGWKWRPDSCFGTLRQSLTSEQWNLAVSEPSNNSWKSNQEVWFVPGIPPYNKFKSS